MRVQAPVAGAQAGSVDGWTATATPDGAGNTVLEWTGGSLPADEAGAFPVEFTVPDAVGTLLAFPAVQRCANGDELAWIGTAPGDEFPAPQVLVLAAGSEPAATLDDVPADAPGRELLVALAAGAAPDDNIAAPATTATPASGRTRPPSRRTAAPPTDGGAEHRRRRRPSHRPTAADDRARDDRAAPTTTDGDGHDDRRGRMATAARPSSPCSPSSSPASPPAGAAGWRDLDRRRRAAPSS